MDLNGRRSDSIDLLTAINECGDLLLPSIALLYTHDWCGFAQVESIQGKAKFTVSPGDAQKFDQAMIFEARIFSEKAELRWMKQWPGQGRAALIAEHDISNYLEHEAGRFAGIEAFNQPYLLWGEGTTQGGDLATNWSRLAMARIGTLDVPYPLNSGVSPVNRRGQRIYLITREYLAAADDHGNVSVIDERLLKLVDENELSGLGSAGLVELEVCG